MKHRIALYLLLVATLCMGCGGHGHMRQLERLEAQLDTAPDVVRLALDSIPLASLSDEARALGSGTLSCKMGGKSSVIINFSGDVNWIVDKIEGDEVTFIKYKCTISQGTFDIQNSTGSFIVSIS